MLKSRSRPVAPTLALRDSLRVLREGYPALAAALAQPERPDWLDRLERSVLPALDFDVPVLLTAICGGGSTGKSSLFNALAGHELSQVAFRAGLTRRVILAGHPEVLASGEIAAALLHRLPARPEPWRSAEQASEPGPPLYAGALGLPKSLMLLDTPDFDTGEGDRLVNRERAEPILRTAEVIVYLFTNAVYNNLSNLQFMADVVGGIGGRAMVLIYRISRTAPDDVVLEHCQHVAQRLYGAHEGWPAQIVGVYRIHESDRVAQGIASPEPLPVGALSQGRSLPALLADLDVAAVKRQVFAADLAVIREGAASDLRRMQELAQEVDVYTRALQHLMALQGIESLKAFPVNEAVALATRVFLGTSPAYVRAMRQTGRIVGAPFRAVRAVVQRGAEALGLRERVEPAPDLSDAVTQGLLLAANEVRNRLLDDHLIVSVSRDDALLVELQAARSEGALSATIEALGDGRYNLHVPAPSAVQQQEATLMRQDWQATTARLREAARSLVGLPGDIERELTDSVLAFRRDMGLGQRLREAFFALLSALPPLLGVTYTLLTADAAGGAGLLIKLEGVFGVNDLWALLSIPASAGLSEQDQKQLQQMIAPVFRLWLQRRTDAIVALLGDTVAAPVTAALAALPRPDDPRLQGLQQALRHLEG
ncbi:MAG: hypothetical protein ACOX3S_14020 [Anaerolineae bacterium]|jgi:hypothetical protein